MVKINFIVVSDKNLTSALLGPSTAMESPPAPAPLVEMVKRAGSPVTPATNPGPYAVTYPDEIESTWNLNGEPEWNAEKLDKNFT